MIKKNKNESKDNVQIAYDAYENVFTFLKNCKIDESNKHHTDDPDRVEHDFSEMEKEHLALLRTKLKMEISEKAVGSSTRLSKTLNNLTAALVAFSFVLAVMAILEW